MHLKEFALRIGTDHGGTGCRMSQDLDQRVYKGGGLTGTGSTDDDTVAGRHQVDIHFLFLLVVDRVNRHTVLFLFTESTVFLVREQVVTFLIR